MKTMTTSTRCCLLSKLLIRHFWQVLLILTVPFIAKSQIIDLGQINRNTANVQYDHPLYSSPDVQKN
jgi:hypothetical protein